MDTAAKISTPCIRVCKLLNDVCYACQRTRQEITEIMEELNERRKRK
jgi:predicted Fe-S protein YdhL (DUF1289 family)